MSFWEKIFGRRMSAKEKALAEEAYNRRSAAIARELCVCGHPRWRHGTNPYFVMCMGRCGCSMFIHDPDSVEPKA